MAGISNQALPGLAREKPVTNLPKPPYALVVLDRSQSQVEKELTYAIPDRLRETLRVGFSVLVPVGKKYLTGYVTGFVNSLDFEPRNLRPIARANSTVAIFDSKSLQLARWMSAYYHCPLADCVGCFVPQGSQQESQRRYSFGAADAEAAFTTLLRSPKQFQVAQFLAGNEEPRSQKEIEKALKSGDTRDALKKLVEAGIVKEEDELLEPTIKPRRLQAVRAFPKQRMLEGGLPKLQKSAPKQAAALEKLWQLHAQTPAGAEIAAVSTVQLAHDWDIELAALRGLEKKGLLEFTVIEQLRAPVQQLPPRDINRVHLTAEQDGAVQIIETALQQTHDDAEAAKQGAAHGEARKTVKEARVVLLQGVTASGKTEVYLNAIEKCLQLGRRALVLVPEIALTAQTVEIFQRRFQERVAILHSALGAGERFDEWRRARAGRADIVVGARSGIFAPCRNLGLIIIDEEHDSSYKQDQTPRYHARDVALKRASLEGSVVVLGSATPSLESYQRATRGEWAHAKMLKRVAGRPLPEVEVVDMTAESKMGSLPVFSVALANALCETVSRGEQAILFLNRRGFSVYVQCLGCGHVERCPNCDVALTFHRAARMLRCHHCDHSAEVIDTCPECQGNMIGFSGTGTEKVESEMVELLRKRGLSNAHILRLDRDTTARKGEHGKILGEFRQQKAQVLIGTQMVTKGLDFPHVTLVGVIAADTALNMPDFRAAERTFQLLAQVAGRAGRGEKPGRVLVQTLDTDHYAIEAARTQDYEAFVKQEIEFRGSPGYPPFSHIINVISHDEDEGVAKTRLAKLAVAFQVAINNEGGGTELLGPVECPLGRVKNRFRFHLLLRDRNRPRLHRILRVYDELSRDDRSGLIIDVDAMSLL